MTTPPDERSVDALPELLYDDDPRRCQAILEGGYTCNRPAGHEEWIGHYHWDSGSVFLPDDDE